MNVRHLYRRLRPLPVYQRTVSNFIDQHFWQSIKDIKTPWRKGGRAMRLNDIYYLETPYILSSLVDYASLERYVACLGNKTILNDRESCSHHWFMEETIMDTLKQEQYEKNDKVLITQRNWFYQDFHTQNSKYPEKIIHFINVFPENGKLKTGTIWNSINHDEWYPEWEDYDDEVDGFQGYTNENEQEIMYYSIRE